MKPVQLHHTSIRVENLERSRAFYERVLGMAAVERPNFPFDGRWYGLGAGQLHLIEAPAPGPGLNPIGPHFAIEVADLDAARRELAAAGLEVLDSGGNQLWVHDPDGYTVEITGPSR